MNIQILLDCPGFLVCVKPPGILSESPGLPDRLAAQANLPELYPVNRLDKGTGGVAVLAKNKKTCTVLSEMFQKENMEKEYLAVITSRKEIPLTGRFEDLLYHDQKQNKTFIVQSERKGVKKAVCEWKILQSVQAEKDRLCLVRIFLHTGRTHQIRVQFASRGMPLAGDARYGSKLRYHDPALWAYKISFFNPDPPSGFCSCKAPPPNAAPWCFFNLSDPSDG